MSTPLQRVASLRRRAQVNASAASYWLRRVLDDGGAKTRRVHARVPGVESAMHLCLVQTDEYCLSVTETDRPNAVIFIKTNLRDKQTVISTGLL